MHSRKCTKEISFFFHSHTFLLCQTLSTFSLHQTCLLFSYIKHCLLFSYIKHCLLFSYIKYCLLFSHIKHVYIKCKKKPKKLWNIKTNKIRSTAFKLKTLKPQMTAVSVCWWFWEREKKKKVKKRFEINKTHVQEINFNKRKGYFINRHNGCH